MYPTKTELIKHSLPVTYDNCLDLLNTSSNMRPFFKKEGPCTHIGQVIARFIGIPHDETAYYNQLYDYVHSQGLILLSDSSLKESNALNHLKSIEKIIEINKSE